jgi:hypothetical protein
VSVCLSTVRGLGSLPGLKLAERKRSSIFRAAKASVAAVAIACVAAGCSGDEEEPQGRAQPSLVAEIVVQGGSRRERELPAGDGNRLWRRRHRESLGRAQEAIRHMAQYRKLVAKK